MSGDWLAATRARARQGASLFVARHSAGAGAGGGETFVNLPLARSAVSITAVLHGPRVIRLQHCNITTCPDPGRMAGGMQTLAALPNIRTGSGQGEWESLVEIFP